MSNIKAYVKYSEIVGRTPSMEEFLERLRRIGLRSLMMSLSALIQIIDNDGVVAPTLQARLCVRAMTHGMLRRLAALQNADERVVFFPQQILFTMKMAILHAPDVEDGRPDEEFRDALVELLLMASDFLDTDEFRETGAALRQALLSLVVRNFLLNMTDQFRYMVPRAAVLFLGLPNDPELQDDPDYLDLPALFQEASGFALRDFIAFGMAILPWFIDQSELRGTFNPERQSINPTTFFSQARIDGAVARALLTTLAHDHESLTQALRRRLETAGPNVREAFDFLPFMMKPLYRVREDILVPCHLTYLGAKFSGGIYWTILDSLHGPKKKRFTRFVGRIFEVYVRRAIQRAIPEAAGLARRVYPEFAYRVRAGERRTSDVIVVYGRAAIFMEATASRIRYEETAISGDLGAFDEDIEKIILKKARQLTDRIRDFRAGRYTIGGLTPRDIPIIYPVIVTLQPVPETTITWEYLNERLAARNLLQDGGVEALQLLDVEEIEILETILRQGVSLLELLQLRMGDPERRYISMKNFLIARFEERGVNEYLLGQYRELGAHATALLFGDGN